MTAHRVPIGLRTWVAFTRVVKDFVESPAGPKAVGLFLALLLFLVAVNTLNVVGSYVGRNFMTAIEMRSMEGFVYQGLVYVGVFAASTFVAVVYRYVEERLALLSREWMTRRLVTSYLADRVYYRLHLTGKVTNPDQRIADDVRMVTVSTLSFTLMVSNASMTIVAFSGVLWSISPLLFGVAVAYAAGGSLLTVYLGRRLVWLNYSQEDKEANFRASLIHVRENAEAVAMLQREGRVGARAQRQLDELVANWKRVILVNRNLSFFTTGYNYLIQIIPALIVAPMFIRGEVEFGVITQSAMAFSHLLGAFSLIVNQFQQISSYAAMVARVGALGEAVRELHRDDGQPFEVVENHDHVAYEGLTLRGPDPEAPPLLDSLSVSVARGTRLLVTGPNDAAKLALLRATAGVWTAGEGRIVRPPLSEVFFLPERPYLSPGTMRELLLRTGQERVVPDERIDEVLLALEIETLVERAGGLDVEHDWGAMLSLAEQQMVMVARLVLAAPRFAFLFRIGTTLGADDEARALDALERHGITYVVLAGDESIDLERYDEVLAIAHDGAWALRGGEEDGAVREASGGGGAS